MLVKSKLNLGNLEETNFIKEKNIQVFTYIQQAEFDYDTTLKHKRTYENKIKFITDNWKYLLVKYYRNGYNSLSPEEQDFIDDYLKYTKEAVIMKIENLQVDELRYLKKMLNVEIDKLDVSPELAENIRHNSIKKLIAIEKDCIACNVSNYENDEYILLRRIYQKIVKAINAYQNYQKRLNK